MRGSGLGAAGTVPVAGGRVRGRERDGVWEFVGIPYARAPVGRLRWRPPEPPEPWSGVRAIAEFGPIAPQAPPPLGTAIPGDPSEQSEDCLLLNVWTPSLDDRRRPVLVWIHGGAFTGGSGASVLYRGDHLARLGDVVVVTCNYRLGALGFLGHPALADGPGGVLGNSGLLDQVAVLRWVRSHIAAFGGDPGAVTVFGESAGAMSVSTLLAMSQARGLFRRAIVQSGPPYTHTPDRAMLAVRDLAEVLELREISRPALEAVPAADLIAAQQVLQSRSPRPGELPVPFLPVVDGQVLPGPPLDLVAAGAAAGVDVVLGTNRDELAYFGLADQRLFAMDDAALLRWLARAAPGADVGSVLHAYRRARSSRGQPTDSRHLWVATGSDLVFRWPTWTFAGALREHHQGVFVYLFTYETPAFDGLLGSCHALDVPLVFGSHTRPGVGPFVGEGPHVDHLAAQMQHAWLAFARTGRPAHPGIGEWAPWDLAELPVMVFGPGDELGQRHGPAAEELAAWTASGGLGGAAVAAGPALLPPSGIVSAPEDAVPGGAPEIVPASEGAPSEGPPSVGMVQECPGGGQTTGSDPGA